MVQRVPFRHFSEALGSVDYARWRRELVELASSAGPDFTAALLYKHDIPSPSVYPLAAVLLDNAAGGVVLSMPQMRQAALLSCIRAALDPNGESIKMIADCVHAGGTVLGTNQALITLDIRWRAPVAPPDFGGKSAQLYAKAWPVELSVDGYTSHFNTVVSLATEIGHNPIDESAPSQKVRAAWWRVVAEPPMSSPYYEAAREARIVTGQRNATITDRQDWLAAMCKAVALLVSSGSGQPSKALVRQPQIRFGGIQPGDVLTPPQLDAAQQLDIYRASGFPASSTPSFAGMRKCPRCPLDSNKQPIMHPPNFRCNAVGHCAVCKSSKHLDHACFIKHGVPRNVKMSAEVVAEIQRLHQLYLANQFDAITTPTTLNWLLAYRRRQSEVAARVGAAEVGYVSDEFEYIDSLGVGAPPSSDMDASNARTGGELSSVVGQGTESSGAPQSPLAVCTARLGDASCAVSRLGAADSAAAAGISDRYTMSEAFNLITAQCGVSQDGSASNVTGSAFTAQCDASGTPGSSSVLARTPNLSRARIRRRPGVFSAQVSGRCALLSPDSSPTVATAALPNDTSSPRRVESQERTHGNSLPRVAISSFMVVMAYFVASVTHRVFTDHLLVDSSSSGTTWRRAWAAALYGFVAYVPAMVAAVFLLLAFPAVVDRGVALMSLAARRGFRAVGGARPPLILAAVIASLVQVAWSAPAGPLTSVAAPVCSPAVEVRCSYALSDMMDSRSSLAASTVGAFINTPATHDATPWSSPDTLWRWIVDSGADLPIAGSFIYPYSTVIKKRPNISVRGIRNQAQQVDAIVRVVVMLPDGEHCIREVLVCDPIVVALWSVPYMSSFGYSTFFGRSGLPNVIFLPSGRQVEVMSTPYRLLAPCRPPTPAECRDPPAAPQPHTLPRSAPRAPSPPLSSLPLACVAGPLLREPQTAPSRAGKAVRRSITDAEAWRLHHVMGHAGWDTVARTHGVHIPESVRKTPCAVCRTYSSTRQPQLGHEVATSAAGQLTHTDTWGPFMSALYYTGCRYIITFVDDYSRVRFAVFAKDRVSSTLVEGYKLYLAFMRRVGVEIASEWMSDGGPEYVSEECFDFCDEHAIKRLVSCRYVPPQNGVAEAVFRVYIPRARKMLAHCGALPAGKRLYALALQHALWLSNRTFSRSTGCRPFDRVPSPPKLDFSDLRPFGCRIWAHQPHVDVPDKMSPTAREGVFVGMSELYKGYIVYYPDTHEFEAAIHVTWDAEQFPLKNALPPPPPPRPLPESAVLPPVHVQERVRFPMAPMVPGPSSTHPQLLVPSPAGAMHRPPADDVEPETDPPLRPRRRPFFAHSPPLHPRLQQHGSAGVGRGGGRGARVGVPPQIPLLMQPRRPGSRASNAARHLETAPRTLAATIDFWLAGGLGNGALGESRQPSSDDTAAHAPLAVVLFAGPSPVDLETYLQAHGFRVATIDVLVGGRTHDLTRSDAHAIGPVILDAARRGGIAALHSAVPCQTFSVSLDDQDMVRSAGYPAGLPDLPMPAAARLFVSNALLRYTLDVAFAVAAGGGEVTIENPAPRNDVSLTHVYWPEKAHHASLFQMPEVGTYADSTNSSLVTFPMCALGLAAQKYTSVLATPAAAAVLAPLDGLQCTHGNHPARAYGTLPEGSSASRAAGRYPASFSRVLAAALAGTAVAPVDVSGDAPLCGTGCGGGAAQGAPMFAAVDRPSAMAARVAEAPDIVDAPYLREFAMCVPGYAPPADPGWHGLDDADASDEECDVFMAEVGGCVQAFVACTKQPVDVMKAQARVRWSQGPDGMRRHEVPRGYSEYLRHPNQDLIFEAMQREMDSHEDCGTWEYRDASECYDSGRTPIDCMWVYDCKVDTTSKKFLLWKARLVGRGDQMEYLRDFFATYSGVVRHETFRIFLATAALLYLTLTGADVSTAYLHAPLRDTVVWMRQPKGFPQVKVNGKPALCRLRMALYGLRQSAREWALTLIAWLEEWGFARCVADRYLFVWHGKGDDVIYLLVWVDDIFMGHRGDAARGRFMEAFQKRFRVKDLGLLRQALGASVTQSMKLGTVSLSLESYISDVARRFDLHEDVSWADIPVPIALAKECTASTPTEQEILEHIEVYRILVGSVVFIATFARPDVAFAAHFLACFLQRPGRVHLRLARRVLGYLSRTRALALAYSRSAGSPLVSFSPGENETVPTTLSPGVMVDTDHGVVRSVTGWLLMLGGAAVSWAVRGQRLPALSSAEAELYGLSTAVCNVLVCISVLEELGVLVASPVPVFTDSRGARLLALDCASAARTRHIHRRWFFVRHHTEDGSIIVKAVKGSDNHANFLTKPVGGASFASDRKFALNM